jgi:hypothetical protein
MTGRQEEDEFEEDPWLRQFFGIVSAGRICQSGSTVHKLMAAGPKKPR